MDTEDVLHVVTAIIIAISYISLVIAIIAAIYHIFDYTTNWIIPLLASWFFSTYRLWNERIKQWNDFK